MDLILSTTELIVLSAVVPLTLAAINNATHGSRPSPLESMIVSCVICGYFWMTLPNLQHNFENAPILSFATNVTGYAYMGAVLIDGIELLPHRKNDRSFYEHLVCRMQDESGYIALTLLTLSLVLSYLAPMPWQIG